MSTPTQSVTPWYLDKSLYLTVLGILLPFVGGKLGLQLDPEKVAAFVIPVVAYVVAHKWKSGKVLVAEIQAKAQAAVTVTPPALATPANAASAVNAL